MISAIVAVDNNWGIGYNGDLLEHIPEDLKRFKELTSENVVVMGRKTWESLPKKPLPNRTNVIVSSQYICEVSVGPDAPPLVKCDMAHCIYGLTNPSDRNIFIIGGGEIYKQLLPYCDCVYVTKIYKEHSNVDTYFPNLDKLNNWEAQPTSEIKEYNNIKYQFWKYQRI